MYLKSIDIYQPKILLSNVFFANCLNNGNGNLFTILVMLKCTLSKNCEIIISGCYLKVKNLYLKII